jgi:uncharacterized protein
MEGRHVEPRLVDDPAAGRYELHVDGELAGFVEYHLERDDVIAYLHTEVLSQFEGQGLGKELVARVLDDARERDRQVLPYCRFLRTWMERHPEYLDLIPEDRRAGFGV